MNIIQTFVQLQEANVREGQRFTCVERANAEYTVQPSGYTARAGDVTFSNGLIGELQIKGTANLLCFGMSATASGAVNAQAIIDALSRAGRLYIPKGTYDVGTPLNIPNSEIIIEGDGRDATKINLVNTTGLGIFFKSVFPNRGQKIQLRDFSIRSNVQRENSFNLAFYATDILDIQRITVADCFSGILLSGCSNVNMNSVKVFKGANTATLQGVGISLIRDAEYSISPITNCLFQVDVEAKSSNAEAFDAGFLINASDGIWLTDCHSYLSNDGILISGASNYQIGRTTIENCYLDLSYNTNLHFTGATTGKFFNIEINSTFLRAAGSSSVLAEDSCSLQDVSFNNCRFEAAGSRPLDLSTTNGLDRLAITNCKFYGNNTTSLASSIGCDIKALNFIYTGNVNATTFAGDSDLIIRGGSNNILVTGNSFSSSANTSNITDNSGAVTKLITNNLL